MECLPYRNPVIAGSTPVCAAKYCTVAQLVEQTAVNRPVTGSSPVCAAKHLMEK